jgi:prephenate dehydratase
MSNPLKIAYLGPAGTFTEMAAKQLTGADAASFIAVGSVGEALEAVLANDADRAVVPIENSLEGGVSATMDALASTAGVQIYGEYLVPVTFDLMASPGPSEIVITTAEPFLACVDATGNWLETRSTGICGSGAR